MENIDSPYYEALCLQHTVSLRHLEAMDRIGPTLAQKVDMSELPFPFNQSTDEADLRYTNRAVQKMLIDGYYYEPSQLLPPLQGGLNSF